MRRADAVSFGDSINGSTDPKATSPNDAVADVGWPTSTCVVGIVLQQSSPWWWWWDMHRIDLQHCMAFSAVAIPTQSIAQLARATARTTTSTRR